MEYHLILHKVFFEYRNKGIEHLDHHYLMEISDAKDLSTLSNPCRLQLAAKQGKDRAYLSQ